MKRHGGGIVGASCLIPLLVAACASAPAPLLAPEPAPAARAPAAASVSQPQKSERRPSSISAEALGLYRTPEESRRPPSDDELRVIDSAKTLVGKPPNAQVLVNGKKFVLDCIGTVSAIFYRMAIDVTKDFGTHPGNGVNRLYMTLQDKGVLHSDKYPRTGDVVIWDNTWDANGDGDRTNDPRTHAGVVLAVDDDGTIHYVHENMYKGVIIETMNLLQPGVFKDDTGKTLNNGLAIATTTGGPRPTRWLSGDVFNKFGDVLQIKDYLRAASADLEAAPVKLAMSDESQPQP